MAEFTHALFGCYDNLNLCILTYFFPCYTVGKTAEAIGESCFFCGLAYAFGWCFVGALIRDKVRQKYNIDGTFSTDLLVHCCCPFCAVIQEYQEVCSGGQIITRE